MRLSWIVACLCMLIAASYGEDDEFTGCSISQFQCATGDHCISMAWRCDRGPDCPDASDEVDCPITTCADNFFRCNNGKCIPGRWVCDDNDDCEDKSDETEKVCMDQSCDGYRCEETGQCIPDGWRCDGANDCKNSDDERNCTTPCDEDEFQCSDGKCIDARWHCDHREDCDDGSDELNCDPSPECSGIGEKQCNDGECLNESWFCDGEADCKDGSDEHNCTTDTKTCAPHEFKCALPLNNPECVNWSWKCDSFPDCSNGSDEEDCDNMTCRSDERKCDKNYCIKEIFFCDGEEDCTDGSDEKDCANVTTVSSNACGEGHFDCFGNGDKCVSNSKICDGARDCPNGADEAADQNCPPNSSDVCSQDNGGCMQVCIPTLLTESKRRCECYPGYKPLEDKPDECQDINECEVHGTCSQLCANTKGSYKCSCMQGYELTNHRYCKAIGGKRPMLILSSRNELRSYHLDTFHYKLLLEQVSAVAIDFNIRKNTVFWTDVNAGKVHSANLDTNEVNTIINTDINMPDGIAVDWIHDNLYLADTGSNRIEVARLDGTNRKILIEDDLDEPRSLVLDPHNGWMYWTDWGSQPKIEKCGMNGKNRKVIVQQLITWPNGLTIDYVGQRLYWVDAKLRNIGSTNLDGEEYKLVLTDHRNLGHPFAITVFEDYLYWTDWMTNAVHRVSKFGKDTKTKEEDVTTIAPHLKSPMDIHVYHIFRQPATQNRCEHKQCSHLCLPKPQLEVSSPSQASAECACPNNMHLISSTQCAPDVETTTHDVTEKPAVVTQKPAIVTESPAVTEKPSGPSTGQEIHVDVSTEVSYGVHNQTSQVPLDVSANPQSKAGEEEGHGVIMVIVIVVLVIVGGAISAVVFILVRRHRKKNVMSMNFDNPVYRKTTTEDQLVIKDNATPRDSSMQPLNSEPEVV